MHLTKQKGTLISYCQTKNESSIVNAMYSLQVYESESDYIKCLIDYLAEWRWMAGINNQQTEDELAQELVMLAKFVSENYPIMKREEFKLAVSMSLTNMLDVDVRTFNTFSPMYVSRILNSYLEQKRKVVKEVRERKDSDDLKKDLGKQPTQQEKMDSMVELITYLYDGYKEVGEVKDYFNTLYNYLKRTNKISIPKQQVDEAMQYGKLKAIKYEPSTYEKLFEKKESDNSSIEKRYARNYCIQKLFDVIGLDGMIAKVELKDF